MTIDGIEERRITRLEYERMIECGIFVPGDRVELIAGALLVAEPQGTRHASRPMCCARCLALVGT